MKRIISILIALCYLCASTGFTLHEHYCMGEHISTTLWEKAGDIHKCERCGMEKRCAKSGCCKDEHKIVKASDDAAVAKAFLHQSPLLDFALPAPIVPILTQSAIAFAAPKSISGKPHGPPLLSSLRLHVRNCVFLI